MKVCYLSASPFARTECVPSYFAMIFVLSGVMLVLGMFAWVLVFIHFDI